MTLWNFLKDKFLLLILHLVCMGMSGVFLKLTGYSDTNIAIIFAFWIIVLAAWLAVTYFGRKRYFDETEQILAKTDQRYLLGELIPDSFRLEDRLYREMIRKSNKAVIEKIRQIEDSGQEYREYIENWVHEVKAPITGISLLCENGRKVSSMAEAKENLRFVMLENQKTENYVDLVLYYARSENVYKDFIIRETDLQEIAEEVLDKEQTAVDSERSAGGSGLQGNGLHRPEMDRIYFKPDYFELCQILQRAAGIFDYCQEGQGWRASDSGGQWRGDSGRRAFPDF